LDREDSSSWPLKFLFLIALAATLGSLYFGEILKYPPCTLCWYQRICMYPLVVIFGAAIWSSDSGFLKYSLLLSITGLLIASYHNLLYYGIIPDNITPCSQGVSCTTKQIEMFGFLTIPLMSWICFLALNAMSFFVLVLERKKHEIK
jgi:disulfide bond formation protein DsbB